MCSAEPLLQSKSMYMGYKWHHPVRNLQACVVVMREDNTLPTQWPLARIVETHAGKDGYVRVVKLKTKDGMYARPTTRVGLLLLFE